MKLIFCIDSKKGMMFFGKRQSQDGALREKLLSLTESGKLYMSEYSAKQFEENPKIIVTDGYMNEAGKSDYCFIEDKDYSTDSADEIILCHWNRHYPADRFFDIDLKKNGFKKEKSEDIKGTSHERITIETYVRAEK